MFIPVCRHHFFEIQLFVLVDIEAQQCIQAPLRHHAVVVWRDEFQGRVSTLHAARCVAGSFFLPARGGGGVPAPSPWIRYWHWSSRPCTHRRKNIIYLPRKNTPDTGFILWPIKPGAVKLLLALWHPWMHVTQVHPVTSENQFHCTRLYKMQDSNFWLFVCTWWGDDFRLLPERVPMLPKYCYPIPEKFPARLITNFWHIRGVLALQQEEAWCAEAQGLGAPQTILDVPRRNNLVHAGCSCGHLGATSPWRTSLLI